MKTRLSSHETEELFKGKMKFPGTFRKIDAKKDLDYALEFTKVYQSENDKYLREANCLTLQTPYILSEIADNEKIVGLSLHGFVGFSPQWGGLYTYYFKEEAVLSALEEVRNTVTNEYIKDVEKMVKFWDTEATIEKHHKKFAELMPNSTLSEHYSKPGFANADVRLAGTCVDLDKLIKLGVNGLKNDLKKHVNNFESKNLFLALDKTIDTITLACDTYIEKINNITDNKRKEELKQTLSALKNIRTDAPKTFFEGLQLMWLYAMISDLMNYGRLDVSLGDLYASDLANNITTEEDAILDILSFYQQLRKIGKKHDARVILGGKGRRNEENADMLAILFMEATRRFNDIVPQLTYRYYKGCNDAVYNKALKVNSLGLTFPIIYSDETNIPAVMKVYGVTYEEACNYMPFGCGEYVLEGLSLGTPNNGLNMLKALDQALHCGFDSYFNVLAGEKTKPVSEITSFEDLFTQFENQVKPGVRYAAYHKKLNYSVAAEQGGYLHMSLLMNDCFKNGKALLEGGVRYENAASEIFGIVSCADSLTAIKKLVFDTNKFTLSEVVNILDNDFEGYENEHKIMVDAPKYGNDDEYADSIMQKVFNFIADETLRAGNEVGLHRYNIVSVNNSMSAEWGYYCSASACGRKSGAAMSNGNGSSIGADKKGITALLNSMSKIDHSKHVGVIHNIRFSKEMFTKDFDKVKSVLTTFYNNGGVQTNIACVGRGDLEKALVEPEKYQNLIVRIGGFSERFVELNSVTQKEIMERTTY